MKEGEQDCCERNGEESKKRRGNGNGSRKTGSRYSERDGGVSDANEAGDTRMWIRRNAVVGAVLELQSANALHAHRAIPSLERARREEGEEASKVSEEPVDRESEAVKKRGSS